MAGFVFALITCEAESPLDSKHEIRDSTTIITLQGYGLLPTWDLYHSIDLVLRPLLPNILLYRTSPSKHEELEQHVEG